MQFRPLTSEIFDDVVQFIAQTNAEDRHHIGYFDTDAAAVAQSLQEFTPPAEKSVMVARQDSGSIVGVMGVKMDTSLGRMWLHGPLIQHHNWQEIADILYQTLQPVIPLRIDEYEIFCSIHNQNCQEFAQRHKYSLHGEAAIYTYHRERFLNNSAAEDVIDITPPLFEQLRVLQDRLFPRSYYSGHQLTMQLHAGSRVFVTQEDDTLTGYIACRAKPQFGIGYIDFVGVLESVRRRGHARKLLNTAFNWMFSYESIQVVKLTVMTRNEAACQLYETAGFERTQDLVAYRKRYV